MVKRETRKISADRKPKNKKIKKVVLIAVEGNNKTEKLYFKHFDDGKKSYVIKIAQGNYTDPLNLISSLANAISNAKKLEAYQVKNAKVIGSVSCNPNTEVYKIIEYLQNLTV